MTSTYDPCVCVQDSEKKSVRVELSKTKPQEGGLCVYPHITVSVVVLLCCCFVAMHIASSSGGKRTQSTSSLLAQSCEWLA